MVHRVSREGISQPHPHDVLCGGGSAAANDKHFGNTVFIDIVLRNKHLFSISPDHHKAAVAKGIVDAIRRQDPPGRFIALNKKEGLWYEIENRQAIGKTNKALRKGPAPASISSPPKTKFMTADVPLKPPSGGGGVMSANVTSSGNKRGRDYRGDGNQTSDSHAFPKKIRPEPNANAPPKRARLPIFRPPQAQQPRVNKPNVVGSPAPTNPSQPTPTNAPSQENVTFGREPFHNKREPLYGARRSADAEGEEHIGSSGFLPTELLDNETERKLMQEYDDRTSREPVPPHLGGVGGEGGGVEKRVSLVRTDTFPPSGLILPRSSLKADISRFGEPGVSSPTGRRRSSRFSLTMPFGLGQRLSKLFHEPLSPDNNNHQFDDPVEDSPVNDGSLLKLGGRKERQLSLFEDDEETEQIERLRVLDPSKPSGHIPAQRLNMNGTTLLKNENQPSLVDPNLQPPELQPQVSLNREISDFFANLNPTSILRGISLTGNKREDQQQHDLQKADEEELDDAFLSHSERKHRRDQKIGLLSERSKQSFDEIENFALETSTSPSHAEPARATAEHRWSISSSFLGGSRRVSKLFGAVASIEPPAVEDVGAL